MTTTVDHLERRLFQLETLYEIGRECARVQTLPAVLQVILSMLMGSFSALRGLAVVGDRAGAIEAFHARGLTGDEGAEAARRCLSGRDDSWLPEAGLELLLPFEIDESSRGAIALGPRLAGAPYSADDRALLRTIVDNACPYVHNLKLLSALRARSDELARGVEALRAANELALAVASHPSASRLHRELLDRIAGALGATEGVMLLDQAGEWRVATQRGVEETVAMEVRAYAALHRPGGRRSARELLATVEAGGAAVGALWLRRDPAAQPFDAEDEALLQFLANQAGLLIENTRLFESFLTQQQEQFRLRGMLEQYLAPAVAERLITGETRPALEGTRLTVTVLMVDMRASTELINHVQPEVMVRLLNQYLGAMTDVLFRYEGTVDKFSGDAVLGFFGAPEAHPDDPLRAVRAAAAMQRQFAALHQAWRCCYLLPARLGAGIGIATGDVVVGNIGSAKRLEHTVIGSAVNLAARLTARAPRGAILLDERTWHAVAAPLGFADGIPRRAPRRIRAKGFEGLVPAYQLRAGDVPEEIARR